MPSFKPKASKKIVVNKKSIVTLDSKYNEKMKEFLDISNTSWVLTSPVAVSGSDIVMMGSSLKFFLRLL